LWTTKRTLSRSDVGVVNFTMCTPSLAVDWLWMVALDGLGRSLGTRDGQVVFAECAGMGHGGGGEYVATGAGAVAAVDGEAASPEPPHAVARTARAAMTRPREPQRRSIHCPSLDNWVFDSWGIR
jgi:hypothetical protein